MGQFLSKCLDAMIVDTSPGDWQEWSSHPAIRHYLVGEMLGKGAFSEVYLAKRKPIMTDGSDCALKVIFLGNPKLHPESKEILKQESRILRKLNHPNIVDVRRTHMWDAKKVLIIEEELLGGDDLLSATKNAIKNLGFTMTESFTAQVMRQVLAGVAYMHKKCVLHRDMKTENLRFTCPEAQWVKDTSKATVKIIDFGLSCEMQPGREETGWLGSPGFVAPEVLQNDRHTPAMDVYSCGVIMFILLTGASPMTHDEAMELAYADTEAREYTNMHSSSRWNAVSAEAQDVVFKMLARSPKTRITALQALQHPFFTRTKLVPSHGEGSIKIATPTPSLHQSPEKPAQPEGAAMDDDDDNIKETDGLRADPGLLDFAQGNAWRTLVGVVKKFDASTVTECTPGSLRDTAEWRTLVRKAYGKQKYKAVMPTGTACCVGESPNLSSRSAFTLRTASTASFAALGGSSISGSGRSPTSPLSSCLPGSTPGAVGLPLSLSDIPLLGASQRSKKVLDVAKASVTDVVGIVHRKVLLMDELQRLEASFADGEASGESAKELQELEAALAAYLCEASLPIGPGMISPHEHAAR